MSSNNTYLKYNHKTKKWDRRYARSRGYRTNYVTYPQSGGRRGGSSMAGLFGAIVIILFIAVNAYSFLSWYFR